MIWDMQECSVCQAKRKTLYAFKDNREKKMCKGCYNKEIKKQKEHLK